MVKNKQKADLNKDGKLSSYEEARGSAIEKLWQNKIESKRKVVVLLLEVVVKL